MWRTANVFTVKQLTLSPGWFLRKRLLKVFSNLRISCYRKLGPGVRCIKGDNGPLPNLVICLSTKHIYLSIYLSIHVSFYLHLLTVTTTRKTLFDFGSLPNSIAICRTFFYLCRILSIYHSITSPPLRSHLFLSFPAKFFKLFKGLLIILPELLRIPFVLNFLRKESQLGRNRIY